MTLLCSDVMRHNRFVSAKVLTHAIINMKNLVNKKEIVGESCVLETSFLNYSHLTFLLFLISVTRMLPPRLGVPFSSLDKQGSD